MATRVARGGASEIDELAHAFNQMATELAEAERAVKTYQAQLEERVEERTLQLRHLAEHDPLTNLPNRRQLFQRLNEMLDAAGTTSRAESHVAVLFLDLDNFKTVNDTLGHDFGDRVLTEIGERLRLIAGDGGFIARLGGDEFTLVFPYSGDAADVERRAERLVGSFQRPLLIDRREVSVGVSCGVATYPEHGRDATSLLRAADVALFRAKELGRNRLCVHDPSMLVQASNRFRVEQALRKAIDGGDFVLHYQPQVCLGRQRTTAVEALLRWRRSDNQIVSAGEFIEIAEQSGLMLDLNDWILETAAEAVSQWRSSGWPDARVAINVSAQQFVTGNFLADIERLLARHGLPPDAIELELTETMLQTGAVTVEALHGLRMLNVDTALDDFGTGFSSLTSIEQLPLSRVKLDRSVIAEVDSNPRSAAIVHSMIGLCRNLGLQVTIEGVERPAQLNFLAACGEVSVQGFLIARPAEESAIIGLVRDTRGHLDSLLKAAEQAPAATVEDDLTSSVRMLRGRRRTHPPVSSAEDRCKRALELRILELESLIEQPPGQHPVADQQQLRHLAEQQLERRLGHRQHRGSAERRAQRPREFGIGDRVRRARVVRATGLRVLQQPLSDRRDVLAVDPREIVAPVAEAAARPHPEGRQHLRERAAVTVEHDADAHHADAHAQRARLPGFALPGRAQVVGEARCRRRVLVDRPVALLAVVADRGS